MNLNFSKKLKNVVLKYNNLVNLVSAHAAKCLSAFRFGSISLKCRHGSEI